jgi:hypothetical protein
MPGESKRGSEREITKVGWTKGGPLARVRLSDGGILKGNEKKRFVLLFC